ncbi:uncharacterized protein LOC134754765 [Cydia strobilella]|uniref:uncharacterized protein LOC134754765 n=1 Tax=Cydia strobilella TaxID=1100964 RepID=UPI003004CB0F
MEPKYVKADSGNLPDLDALVILCAYIIVFIIFTLFHRSARESYGDDAIGYVQLHREHGVCTIKCKVCPETKVRSKAYNVTMVINENECKVISCQCHDCTASAGGCKHAVAFLMWIHRRSEEPACTSIECYWTKPALSRVGTTLKYITVQQMAKKVVPHRQSSSELYTEFIVEAKKRKIENCELLKYQDDFTHTGVMQYSLHCLFMDLPPQIEQDVDQVIEKFKYTFTEAAINTIEEATRSQNKNSMWYEMRYGRITASKAHEVSVCQTPDGSLVAAIMGAKIPDTPAMKRGRKLEHSVQKTVSNKLKRKITSCGFYVCQEYPIIGASPDGVMKDAIIEIKCPTKAKLKEKYLKNGLITEKCKAQVHMQMYATGIKKCYFCVADSNFETTKNVEIIEVTYDSGYVHNLIQKLVIFWKTNIYPVLYRSTNILI